MVRLFGVLDKNEDVVDFVFLKNWQYIQKTHFAEPNTQWTRPKYGGYTKPINLLDHGPQYVEWKTVCFQVAKFMKKNIGDPQRSGSENFATLNSTRSELNTLT